MVDVIGIADFRVPKMFAEIIGGLGPRLKRYGGELHLRAARPRGSILP